MRRIPTIAEEPMCSEAPAPTGSALGPLERQLLELLWRRGAASTVREACAAFPDLAYTTLMTTFDRLYRKGLLWRRRQGRAFVYLPRLSREQWLGERISGHFTELLASETSRTALLSHFVSSVGKRDAGVLDELETLVQAERLRLQNRREDER